jgi:predicted amidohydrolase
MKIPMTNQVKIAAAQFNPVKANVRLNIKKHLEIIAAAVEEKVDLIIFPELSLTGYEPELASELIFNDSDSRLNELKLMATKHNITIVVGAPGQNHLVKPTIASFVIAPNRTIFHYNKIHLHPTESAFFEPGLTEKIFECKNQLFGLSICADMAFESHAYNNAHSGASVYLSSVLISEAGYSEDAAKLKHYASTHKMLVLMANFIGSTGGWNVTGKNAVWDTDGTLLAQAPTHKEALVLCDFNSVKCSASIKVLN